MYKCPYSFKKKPMVFILCKAQMKDGEDYVTTKDCARIACGNTKYCVPKREWVNSDGARDCKYNQKKQED